MNSRSSSIRLMVVDRCLRGGQCSTLMDIQEAVNRELVSRGERPVSSKHTILSDFSDISSIWHADIQSIKRGRKVYYQYSDPEFSIFTRPLSDEEITVLRSTLLMLKRFEWIPTFEWIKDLINRCEDQFKAPVEETAFISLEENPYVQGLKYLQPLYDAIVNKKVLDIWYHSFRYPTAQKNTVHPYYLKQYNNRWFLFCYNEHRGEISNYPLDRIEGIEGNSLPYKNNIFCDFNEYFEDVVGVSKEKSAELETVSLWISSKQWPYFETKPIHGTQKVIEKREDGTVIQLSVIINWELEQLILSQGEHIRVISPDPFREKIKKRILSCVDAYKD